MGSAHTWRGALPGQPCQFPPCRCVAAWVLKVAGGASEELLCAECAPIVASLYGLSDPTTSAGASTPAQTSEADVVLATSASELTTEVSCDE
jgi:hypothetical protein